MAGVDIRRTLARILAAHCGAIPQYSSGSASAQDTTPCTGDDLTDLLEVPPNRELGDFAVPCFRLAKSLKKNPAQTARDLAQAIGVELSGSGAARDVIRSVEAAGPYLNVFINREYAVREVVASVLEGSLEELRHRGEGKTVVIDFSSPNIAKPFGIGHLRSTVIGNSLKKIYSFLGYRVVGINHLGDWGTQFGKLITAYGKWGSEEELRSDPIRHLFQLYVRFHREEEQNPGLGADARSWFSRLESGDGEARHLWERFRDLSLEEFRKIYRRLGVDFEHFTGESYYEGMLEDAVRAVVDRGITVESEGALVVPLDDMPPALIKKSDDATLYLTRDIAAAIYRYDTFGFDLALYVVGSPQSLHFRQLFSVLEKMGFEWVSRCHHVPFGQISFADGAMSTRRGNIVFLEDVLDRAGELARGIIEEKNPELRNKDEVAEAVGVGAIIFNDLKNGRVKDIAFDWDDILNFNGETGPYLQYTHARLESLLKNFREVHGEIGLERDLHFGEEGYDIAILLNDFDETIQRAARDFEPSTIARYLLELASRFNTFYNRHRVVSEDRALSLSRACVALAVKRTLGRGLELLGIEAVPEM